MVVVPARALCSAYVRHHILSWNGCVDEWVLQITMQKHEGARTAVYGGNKLLPQQYCGIVGGQSTDFSTIDTEIKSVGLKNHTLAPPDL